MKQDEHGNEIYLGYTIRKNAAPHVFAYWVLTQDKTQVSFGADTRDEARKKIKEAKDRDKLPSVGEKVYFLDGDHPRCGVRMNRWSAEVWVSGNPSVTFIVRSSALISQERYEILHGKVVVERKKRKTTKKQREYRSGNLRYRSGKQIGA